VPSGGKTLKAFSIRNGPDVSSNDDVNFMVKENLKSFKIVVHSQKKRMKKKTLNKHTVESFK
jgi:hypothetical protein